MTISPLDGKFFHSFSKEGEVEWQGMVIGQLPETGWHLVQLFNWIDGGASIQRIVGIGQMIDWHFYENAEQMNVVYGTKYARKVTTT